MPDARTVPISEAAQEIGKNAPPMRSTDLQVLGELAALRQDVVALREEIADLTRRVLDSDDRRIGSSLVPLLCGIFRDQRFTVAEIAAVALGDTLQGAALRTLIGDRLGAEGGLKSLGRLLARLEGVRFRGYRLVRDGDHRGSCVWRVLVPSKLASRDLLGDDR